MISFPSLRRTIAAFSLATSLVSPVLTAQAAPQWIWAGNDNDPAFFRASITLPSAPKKAEVYSTADNVMTLWINDQKIAESSNWQQAYQNKGAEKLFVAGVNQISVAAKNEGGVAGFVFRLNVECQDGSKHTLESGPSWKVTTKEAAGWRTASFNDAGWGAPRIIGALGMQPWGTPGVGGGKPVPESNISTDIRVPEGFKVEVVYTVPRATEGSWVALTFDPKGRIIASDQGKQGLFRLTLGARPEDTVVEKMPASISSAQGLVWAFDGLYVNVSGVGLFRVTDSTGDDKLDKVEQLPGAKGGGEHGNHAVLKTQDGKGLYVVAGNHTPLPQGVPLIKNVTNWQEDLLLPRQWDARGHAKGVLAPGGWVARIPPDASRYEVYSIGYRNQYDIAMNGAGDMFTFDSDMEWDMGAPWYRPTRIVHVVSGSDFGWRSGSGKWPSTHEDSLPPLVDIGPGSPTGMISGKGAKFPAAYQRAVYAMDWTFGTLYALHLTPKGATYEAKVEEFATGTPFALTDGEVGPDGAMYVAVGGRNTQSALYRIRYTGSESTAPAVDLPWPAEEKAAHGLRRSLEGFHGREDAAAVAAAWPHLDSSDRFIRNAARAAIEAQPAAQWVSKVFSETRPQALITAAVALARVGTPEHRDALLKHLHALDPASLSDSQKLGLLRAYGLTFMRLGVPSDAEKRELAKRFDPLLPSGNKDLDMELVQMLVYLDAPNVVEKTLALIENRTPPVVPDWQALISRNARYGGSIKNMLANPPPTHEIGYAFHLRNVRYGWTLPQRRAYMQFIKEASKFPGGNSFTGFLENIRKEALENCSPAERAALADLTGESLQATLDFTVTPPKGPGRAWTVADAEASLAKTGLNGAVYTNGRNVYHATACAACHRFDGVGGDIGPDLTSVRNKFAVRDLLESIIEPSKVISDQYGSFEVKTSDGKSVVGLVAKTTETVTVYTPDPNAPPVVMPASSVVSVTQVPVSQMPPALINTLSPEELKDLIAYLMSRGNPNDPMFNR